MAALMGSFLLWLFATGNYSDWVALVVAPPVKATPTPDGASTTTKSAAPATGSNSSDDWTNAITGLFSSVNSSADSSNYFDTSGNTLDA